MTEDHQQPLRSGSITSRSASILSSVVTSDQKIECLLALYGVAPQQTTSRIPPMGLLPPPLVFTLNWRFAYATQGLS